MFEKFSIVISGNVEAVLSVAILRYYFSIFLKKTYHKYITETVWVLFYLWQIIMQYTVSLPKYLILLINILLVMIISIVTYTGNVLHRICFSVLICAIWTLMEFLTGYIMVLCGVAYYIPQFMGAMISQFFVLLLLIILKNFFSNKIIRELSGKYSVLLLMIPIGSLYVVYNEFMFAVDVDSGKYTRESLIALVIILTINIIIFYLYVQLSKEMELKKYNVLYEQQLELCKRHIEEKEVSMLEFRNARHDMKQHFIALIGMIEKRENDSAVEYLEKLVQSNNLDKLGICRTDNIVIDSLVNAKYSLAKKENIKMNIDIKIPMQINMDYADLSIVVGNILDNAIEANLKIPSEKRFIDLFARVDKNLLIITIINAYDGILIKDKDGNVLSRKLDINNHGWGLISLKRVVEKYQGSYIIEDKEEIFSLKIMILLRNN